ncbi:uncharacterized protein M6B38_195900 [Iris pallida]|uniref:Uncharacterized protein n=1 Tax=Iris pallida TaxID=29817 RepID=A0AAX6ECF4_IRIPA|nr:uncharacterized protein M6B38_195900 [Iris pallida]
MSHFAKIEPPPVSLAVVVTASPGWKNLETIRSAVRHRLTDRSAPPLDSTVFELCAAVSSDALAPRSPCRLLGRRAAPSSSERPSRGSSRRPGPQLLLAGEPRVRPPERTRHCQDQPTDSRLSRPPPTTVPPPSIETEIGAVPRQISLLPPRATMSGGQGHQYWSQGLLRSRTARARLKSRRPDRSPSVIPPKLVVSALHTGALAASCLGEPSS